MRDQDNPLISLRGFKGMNNVNTVEANPEEPRVILNADNVGGALRKRQGRTMFVPLAGAKNLWADGDVMLATAGGYLYRIQNGTAVALCAITDIESKMWYAAAGGSVYISNKYWCGVLDPATNVVAEWGISIPNKPLVVAGAGSLAPGVYKLCFTKVSGGAISGNGPIAEIELLTEGGITVLNRLSDEIVWCTDTDGETLYACGDTDSVTSAAANPEPLPTFMCHPPSDLTNIVFAHGRIWGAYGYDVLYSLPYEFGLFRKKVMRFSYPEEPLMVAKADRGIYVGTKNKTYFLAGTDPGEMSEKVVGDGVIENTLSYLPALPDIGAKVPIWLSGNGEIMIGSHDGNVFKINREKLRIAPGTVGSALARMVNGQVQYLTSVKRGGGEGVGMGDNATCEVFRRGSLV